MSFNHLWRKSVVPAIAGNCFVIPVVAYVLKGNIQATLFSFIVWSSIFLIISFVGITLAGLDKSDFQDINIYFGNFFSRLRRIII